MSHVRVRHALFGAAAASFACGHREPATRPVANTVAAAPPDATVDAADACATFFATLELAKGCDHVSARTLFHFDQVVQELNHDYTGATTNDGVMRTCADETKKLVTIVSAQCGW